MITFSSTLLYERKTKSEIRIVRQNQTRIRLGQSFKLWTKRLIAFSVISRVIIRIHIILFYQIIWDGWLKPPTARTRSNRNITDSKIPNLHPTKNKDDSTSILVTQSVTYTEKAVTTVHTVNSPPSPLLFGFWIRVLRSNRGRQTCYKLSWWRFEQREIFLWTRTNYGNALVRAASIRLELQPLNNR